MISPFHRILELGQCGEGLQERRVRGLDLPFVDRASALQERTGHGGVAQILVDQAEVEEGPGELRVIGAVDLLDDRLLALEELLGLGEPPLAPADECQGFEGAGEIGIVGCESLGADRQGALKEPLGVFDPSTVVGDPSQVVEDFATRGSRSPQSCSWRASERWSVASAASKLPWAASAVPSLLRTSATSGC